MKLEGGIGEIELIERLVELGREHFTGAIRFENDGIIKIIYFKSGDVLGASTNDRTDSVDEILLRAGKVTREHVKQALARRKESETLGDALLNLGFITRKELGWARRVQVLGIIRSIEGWTGGTFTIVSDYLPKREEGTLFPLQQLLLELIVTDPDRQKFERSLDGGDVTFRKSPDFDSTFRQLGLNQDAEQIAATIDGHRSASEVAAAAGKDGFNTYKLLHALSMLGLLQRVTKPQVSSQGSPFEEEAPFGYVSAPPHDEQAATSFDSAEEDLWGAPEPTVGAEPFALPMTTDASDFAFDDAPSLDFTPDSIVDEPLFEPAVSSSTYDLPLDHEEVSVGAPLTSTTGGAAAMPAWDSPAVERTLPSELSTGADTVMPGSPAGEPEPKWGFDEAQIETARRAAVPLASASAHDELLPNPVIVDDEIPPKRSRGGLIGMLAAILLLAGGGYFGFLWWQKQNERAPEAALTPHAAALRRKAATSHGSAVSVPVATTPSATTEITGSAAPAAGSIATGSVAGGSAAGTSSLTPATAAGTATTASGAPMTAPLTVAPHPLSSTTATSIAPAGDISATGKALPPVIASKPFNPPLRAETPTAAVRGGSAKPKVSRVSAIGQVTNDPTSSTRVVTNDAGKPVITNGSGASTPRPASTKPVPANRPAVATAAVSEAGRERYDSMARDFATSASGAFTVQFELVCQPSSLAKAIKAGGGEVWFVPTTFKGNGCYRVFWGHYATRAEATKAISTIPSALRSGSPAVVAVPKG